MIAAMKSILFVSLQYLLPQHLLSRFVARLASWHAPRWLKNCMLQWFINKHCIDLYIAKKTNIDDYPSFNAFFTRHLKLEERVIDLNDVITSPADGCISQIGKLDNKKILQAKNMNYSLSQLLANDMKLTETFQNGKFITIYLSPRDYHRVHMPYTGKLLQSTYVPGKLFSVNPATIDRINNVFTRNERLINIFQTDNGPMAIILIGAMLVAGIHTVWQDNVAPNHFKQPQTWRYADKNIVLQKGNELGYFNFGSTVILLFPENKANWLPGLHTKTTIQFGQAISSVIKH